MQGKAGNCLMASLPRAQDQECWRSSVHTTEGTPLKPSPMRKLLFTTCLRQVLSSQNGPEGHFRAQYKMKFCRSVILNGKARLKSSLLTLWIQRLKQARVHV